MVTLSISLVVLNRYSKMNSIHSIVIRYKPSLTLLLNKEKMNYEKIDAGSDYNWKFFIHWLFKGYT